MVMRDWNVPGANNCSKSLCSLTCDQSGSLLLVIQFFLFSFSFSYVDSAAVQSIVLKEFKNLKEKKNE